MKKESEFAAKEILTAKETMEVLGISRNTFDRLRAEGIIKVYRLGKKLYCRHSELLQALNENQAA